MGEEGFTRIDPVYAIPENLVREVISN